MASLLSSHAKILVVKTTNNTTELTNTEQEAAGQTFFSGTPVQLNAGNIQAWDGITIVAGLAGVALEDAHNLASAGLGAPSAFVPVLFPGTGVTFGKVQFQPAAVNIPEGAPFSLGMLTYAEAVMDTIFEAQTDNSTGIATTPTKANIGTQYGLSQDVNGFWYVDFAKITPGTNTVLEMYDLDPIDGSIANARILFKFLKSAMQLGQ
jgi:hypothetical protein